MRDGGTYALVIFSGVGLRLQVGMLGTFSFLPGYYVYVGSALGGLSGRLRRHLRSEKKMHWHIDYLLKKAALAQIWYTSGQVKYECTWNGIVKGLPEAVPSIPGFGASDCHCSSHLTYFPVVPSFKLFEQRLKQTNLPQARQIDPALRAV